MDQKGSTNQLFASPTLSIKEEVPEMVSNDVHYQLSVPSSSINIKHEVDPKGSECDFEKATKDIPGYKIESSCIKTEPMFLPFPYDTKEHLKVDSMLEDSNSDNMLESSVVVSTAEPPTSRFGYVKTEKFHDDDMGPNTRYETRSDTTGHIAQSGQSDTKEQRDVSEIDNILPGHLETKLLESAGSKLLSDVGQGKRTLITHSSKGKPYQCEICHKSFSLRGNMMKHQLTHTDEKQFQCDICEKSFSQKSNLNTHHRSVHHDIRPYQCEICHKSFSLRGNMMTHKLTHTKEKQCQCCFCQKSFSSKSSLNHHQKRVHKKIRPHQCDICQKSFTTNQEVSRHKLTHTEEKTFHCDICQKSFSRKSHLKHHQQVHSDIKLPFQCDICQTSFSRNSDLLSHVHVYKRVLVHGKDKYICVPLQ